MTSDIHHYDNGRPLNRSESIKRQIERDAARHFLRLYEHIYKTPMRNIWHNEPSKPNISCHLNGKPKILNNALSTSICLKILLSRFGYCQNLMAANLPSKSFNCKTMDYSLIKKSILRSCISTLFKTTSILSPNAYSLFGFFRFVLCTKPSIPI
jgi:hypothetical protein